MYSKEKMEFFISSLRNWHSKYVVFFHLSHKYIIGMTSCVLKCKLLQILYVESLILN